MTWGDKPDSWSWDLRDIRCTTKRFHPGCGECTTLEVSRLHSVIDRPGLLTTFRERLEVVVRRSGLSRGDFAIQNELDRSTLSQLLSASNRRLPRAETLAEIATTQQVSVDWLLGLSHAGPMQAEMLQEQTSFAEDALSPNDERLIGWFEESKG